MTYKIPSPLPFGLVDNAMPADFGDPAGEHDACRTGAALFDYSFLIRVSVEGGSAPGALLAMTGRNFDDLEVGAIRFALNADADGHLVSDWTVWRTGPHCFDVMTGRAEDAPAIVGAALNAGAAATDFSEITACLALQGPETDRVLGRLPGGHAAAAIPYFRFRDLDLDGVPCRVGRLGFTGLPGVEILCPPDGAQHLWDRLAGSGVRPAGFMAADGLRLRAGLALFTQDFRPPVSAADAGFEKFRPLGQRPADLRPARVRRVGFAASPTPNGDQSLQAAVWAPGDPFPPEPGRMAITSLYLSEADSKVLGMGYIGIDDDLAEVRDPKTGIEAFRPVSSGG